MTAAEIAAIHNYNRRHGLTAYAAKLAAQREQWLRDREREQRSR